MTILKINRNSVSRILKKGEKFLENLRKELPQKSRKKNSVISLGKSISNTKIQNEIIKTYFHLNKLYKNIIKKDKNSKRLYSRATSIFTNLIKFRSKYYSKALYKIKCNNVKKLKK